jgi:oxidase EvaA
VEVVPVPFADLAGWVFQSGTGNLVHESGRFFSVEGLRVNDGDIAWSRPVFNQPEIGILGILRKTVAGVPHFLIQAKVEPGNVNGLQLSPTVQATRSNYTRVHQGKQTRYLGYFLGTEPGRVLVDVLQSEQGAWFLGKRNRNVIVDVDADVPEHEDYQWLTLPDIWQLLHTDNVVGMDCRSVLACLPLERPAGPGRDAFTAALARSYDARVPTRHPMNHVLSWLTSARSVCDWRVTTMPLAEVPHWSRSAYEIADDHQQDFRIVAVRVAAGNREVATWSQPLLAARRTGVAAFLARPVDGVLHVLVHARRQPGLRDIVEIGPTVHALPDTQPAATDGFAATALATLAADPARRRFDTVLSEEGGRFFHTQTRYLVVEAGTDFPVDVPPDFCWLTVHQLMTLVGHSTNLTVEARTLLACLHSLCSDRVLQ